MWNHFFFDCECFIYLNLLQLSWNVFEIFMSIFAWIFGNDICNINQDKHLHELCHWILCISNWLWYSMFDAFLLLILTLYAPGSESKLFEIEKKSIFLTSYSLLSRVDWTWLFSQTKSSWGLKICFDPIFWNLVSVNLCRQVLVGS
jgi:hypothetical protein